jgi:hypothetical protein
VDAFRFVGGFVEPIITFAVIEAVVAHLIRNSARVFRTDKIIFANWWLVFYSEGISFHRGLVVSRIALTIFEVVVAHAVLNAIGVLRANIAVSAIFALIVFPNIQPIAKCSVTFLWQNVQLHFCGKMFSYISAAPASCLKCVNWNWAKKHVETRFTFSTYTKALLRS